MGELTVVPDMEVQGKVNPRDHHKKGADRHNRRAVEKADTGIMGRKAADRYRREAVTDGIECRHARQPIGQPTGKGKRQIDFKQHIGRLSNAWRKLGIFHRPRCFGAIQLHTTDPEHRQNRHGDHHNTNAAEPLQLLAIV